MTREQLLAHPERYEMRILDVARRRWLVRDANSVKPEDLAKVDMATVFTKPEKG